MKVSEVNLTPRALILLRVTGSGFGVCGQIVVGRYRGKGEVAARPKTIFYDGTGLFQCPLAKLVSTSVIAELKQKSPAEILKQAMLPSRTSCHRRPCIFHKNKHRLQRYG